MGEGEPQFGPEDVEDEVGGANEMLASGDAFRAEDGSENSGKQQEYLKYIDQLASETETSQNETIYANILAEAYFADLDFQKLLESHFKGNRIIDLGSGESVFWLPVIAAHAGASEYIGVDKYRLPGADYFNNHQNSKEIPEGVSYIRREFGGLLGRSDLNDLEFRFEKEDMLKFLARQEDGSANIVLSGIDDNIISSIGNPEYIRLLLDEISRVIGKTGVVVGNESAFLTDLEDKGFEVKNIKDGIKVYIKKE